MLHHDERLRNTAGALGAEYHRLVDTAFEIATDQTELAKAQAIARLRLLAPFRDFIIANEEPLRRIAAYSTNLRWMIRYIDFIVRTNPSQGVARAENLVLCGSWHLRPADLCAGGGTMAGER